MIVGFPQEAIDRGLEVDDRAEHAAFEAALGQLGEEALDSVEPGGRGRRVMEHKARMPAEPGPRLGVFVRAVIVEDHVMQRPITLPSRTSRAANNVVVPFLL